MIEYIHLKNVGPSPEMRLDFANRLNLITGDNGLGKSFLLDITWWALTRQWPAQVNPILTSGMMARPAPGRAKATLSFRFTGKFRKQAYESVFNHRLQQWTGKAGRPANPGLVLYAQSDGSFAVWDPARNYYRRKGDLSMPDRPPAFVFGPRDVWDGLNQDGARLCNGLITDWAGWQKENKDSFRLIKAILAKLSPSNNERLVPGELTRISLDDSRDIPTITMPYGQDVPILHASAGIRRIVALAYLLAWSWQEHIKASRLLNSKITRQVIFLIDEVEAHLHPRWQRTIVPTLLAVVSALAAPGQFFSLKRVQLIAATHSPLVLASVEPEFDDRSDAWFDLELRKDDGGSRVALERKKWVRQGDASAWLTSEAFGLASARSIEAESLIGEAREALADDSFDKRKARELDGRLRRVLGDTDSFWTRWRYIGEKRGWLPSKEEQHQQGVRPQKRGQSRQAMPDAALEVRSGRTRP